MLDIYDLSYLKGVNPTKKRILAGAWQVFCRYGFAAGTTKEIARVAAISEGIIFRHFQTKQDLLQELAGVLVSHPVFGGAATGGGKKQFLSQVCFGGIEHLRTIRPIIQLILLERAVPNNIKRQWIADLLNVAAGCQELFPHLAARSEIELAVPNRINQILLFIFVGALIVDEASGGVLFESKSLGEILAPLSRIHDE